MTLSATDIKWLNAYARLSPALSVEKGDGEDGDGDDGEDDKLEALKLEFELRREDEEIAEAERKSRLLAQALNNAFAYKDTLAAAFSYSMGSRGNKQKAVDYEHGNQEDEIDSDDIQARQQKGEKIKVYDKDGKENAAANKDALKAFAILLKEANTLLAATAVRSKLNETALRIESEPVTLFTDAEVTRDFWGALKRARLLSDSMISARFSGTQKMLDAVGQLYIDNELQTASDPTGNVKNITAGIANLGGSIATLVTSSLGVDSSMVKDLIEAGTTLVELGLDAGAMALGIEEKDVQSLAQQVPALLGRIVGDACGSTEVGGLVTAASQAGLTVVSTGISKLKGQTVTGVEIGQIFNECIGAVLAGALQGASGNQEATAILTLVKDAAAAVDFTKAPAIIEGVRKGDFRAVASGVLSMLADIGKATGQLAGDGAGTNGQTLNSQLATDLGNFGTVAGDALAMASSMLLAKDANDLASKIEGAVPGLLGDIATAVTGSFPGLGSDFDVDLTTIVTSGAQAAIDIGTLIKARADGKVITGAQIGAALSDCIATAFAGASAGLDQSSSPLAPQIKISINAVATQLQTAANGFGASPEANLLINGTDAQRKKAAGKLLLLLLINAPAAAGNIAGGMPGGDAQAAANALAQAGSIIDQMQAGADKAEKKLSEAEQQIKDIEAQLQAQRDAAMISEADDILDQVEKEREEWAKQVKAGLQPGGEQKAIMDSIKEMKRNEAIMKAAIAIGGAGLEVAGQFFAPLAAAGQLLKMTAHMTAAVERAMDLKKMLDAQQWAESGSSMYRSAIDAFVKTQGEQLTEHSLKAAMCALRAASEIAASGYPACKAAAAGVAVAQQAMDVGFMIYKEVQMRAAWKITREWLGARNNRRLGLKAQRLNPTLAKYAIAYGAMDGDPVATKTMNAVGLTNQMLQSPEAGVTLLKAWLEARFSEDQKITFKWETTQEWQKKLPAPELTQQNVFAAFSVLSDAAAPFFDSPPSIVASPPNALIGSLNRYLGAAKTHEALKKKSETAREAYKKENEKLAASVKSPSGKGESPDVAVIQAFCDALAAETEAAKDALRLANIFLPAATKVVSGVNGLSHQKGEKDAFKGVRSGMADVVIAYRALMEDEVEMVQTDLMTPLMELVRVKATLQVAANQNESKEDKKVA